MSIKLFGFSIFYVFFFYTISNKRLIKDNNVKTFKAKDKQIEVFFFVFFVFKFKLEKSIQPNIITKLWKY